MRTTIEIDDDLLAFARKLAKENGNTIGQVISTLARKSMQAGAGARYRNGFRQLTAKPGASRADLELVNRLRDEE